MPAIPALAIAASVAGTAMAADGARKTLNAQQDAAKVNATNVNNTNQVNYAKWLATQGVGADGNPQNTWLPRYATVTNPAGSGTGAPVAGALPQFYATQGESTAMPTASPMSNFAAGGSNPSAAPSAGGRSWAGLGINR